jgi:branched-chain amino acid transport system substrate-binding protein
MKRLVIVALALILAGGIILSRSIPANALSQKTLKVGAIFALTGPGSYWGKGLVNGVNLAVEEVNNKGGVVVGGVEYKFKVIPEDSKYKGNLALTAAHKLFYEDKVKYLVGPMGSAGAIAVGPLTTENKVLMGTLAYAKAAIGPDKPYVFRGSMPGFRMVPGMFRWIMENHPEIKTMLHIAPNDETGWNNTREDSENAKKMGFEVIDEIYYERGTTDFAPFCTRIKAKNPDMLSMTGTPARDVALIAKGLRAFGYKGRLQHSASLGATVMAKVAPVEAIEGIISTGRSAEPPYPFMTEAEIELVRKYKAYTGGAWNSSCLTGYSWVHILAQAMKRSKSIDTTKVRDMLLTPGLEWVHVGGKARFDGHELLYTLPFSVIKNGKNVNVGRIMPKAF